MNCQYCGEPLEAGETMGHQECRFRMVGGSVAHIERRCSCYVPGADETDPPGMSLREGARAALRAYRKREGIDAPVN